MAYKFQMTDAILSGTMAPSNDDAFDLGVSGAKWKDLYIDGTAYLDAINYNGTLVSATAAELNYLDNDDLTAADLQKLADVTSTAAELNYLDITTLGTAENSKAFTRDASAGWTAAGSTCADMGIVTTMDLNGGSIDGATIGAAARSSIKATTLSASSTLSVVGASDFVGTITANALGITSMASNWTNASRTVADMGIVTTMDLNGGSVDGTSIGAAAQSTGRFTTLSGSGALSVVGAATFLGALDSSGSVKLAGVPNTALAVASDSFYFLDADGLMKSDSMVDYATAAAGSGLGAQSGQLFLNATGLGAGVIDVAADSFVFTDADDSNVSKKESIVDLVSAMAGAGITATNGVLSSDASPTPNNIGNASANLIEGFNYSSVVFDAVRTWTCPASPDAGDKVTVKAPVNASAYALTVLRAGSQTIDGEAAVVLSSDNGAITLTYLGSDKWAIS